MSITEQEAIARVRAECAEIQARVRKIIDDPNASVTRPVELFAPGSNVFTLISRGITIEWEPRGMYELVGAANMLMLMYRDEQARRAAGSLATRVVAEQAADERLWFIPETITERALLNALRRLHAAVEGDAEMVAQLDPGPNE